LAPKYRHWFFPRMKVLESSNKDNQTQKTKTFQHYLPEGDRCYSCVHCRANLASHNDLISKSFQGSQGKAYLFNSHYLPEGDRCYSCVHCRANLASHNDLISKSFQGSQGKAYLFNSVVNIGTGPAEERVLLTGLHAVADIYCQCCKTTLGWKYSRLASLDCTGEFSVELDCISGKNR
uniref:Protein yippee-like n=1 Tax=Haemonchus placei TaxID=6290 RepID=A0A158QMK5_HAEPC